MLTPEASARLAPIPLPAGPRCLDLEAIAGEPVGGKAAGLARLLRAGLPVPRGFVVLHAEPGRLPLDLAERVRRIAGDGAVAVRSSALAEDGAAASYAGQFATVLDVRGPDAVRRAVEHCLASLESARAEAYRQQREQGARTRMAVVVQAMVDARAAGVLFTADPMTGRRDRLVVDAVAGLGEALVSGHARADHFQASPEGVVAGRDLAGAAPVVSDDEIRALVAGARRARDAFGHPLDLEWAIDRRGEILWLQARPITALPADPHEFDGGRGGTDLCTTGNIGECMPGPLTPLSWFTVWRGNDHGLQFLQRSFGAQREPIEGLRYTRLYLGHLAFSLTAMTCTARSILGASDESLGLAICGRVVPELKSGSKKPFLVRLVNSLRYAGLIFGSKKYAKRLEEMVAALRVPEEATALAQHQALEALRPRLYDAFDWHIASSATPGALEPALMQTLAQGGIPTEEHHAQVAALLASSSHHDVESAEVVAGVERLVGLLRSLPECGERFARASPAEALRWLRGGAGEATAKAFEALLSRHGHHCLRELELREKEWAEDPLPLVESLQVALRARLAAPGANRHAVAPAVEAPSGALRWLVRRTQEGVRQREQTKSLLVKTATVFKRGYRRLGALLVEEGRLPDSDLVFFLTPEELGRLARGEAGGLVDQAIARRRVLAYQATLRFPDVFFGDPEPLGAPEDAPTGSKVLHGKPVSRGKVQGVARVALSLRDASALQPGEILVSPVTDIGWTPYFALIAGLATDVGSSVSHGAVVAREYGLPAVVDLRTATRTFRTGDRVELDGDRGIVRLLDAP